jgi:hypothetical protein
MDELELLGGQLGEDHDLVLLRQFVGDNFEGHDLGVRALNGLMATRHKELRAAALELGSRLYAETPAVFCRRLENHWNAWHGEM